MAPLSSAPQPIVMEAFDAMLAEIAKLRAALSARGDDVAQAIAKQSAQASAQALEHRVEVLRRELTHRAEAEARMGRDALDMAIRSEKLRADVAEAEARNLEAILASVRKASDATVKGLHEEVEALLSPMRGEVARSLYVRRRRDLEVDLAAAKAQRQKLEALLGQGEDQSELTQSRDAALLQAALERETELSARLTLAESRLERLERIG